MGRRALRHGALLAVTAALLLGFVGIAAAALSVRSDSATVPPDEKGSATAKCPRGSEAVAGGFASPGFDPIFENQSIVHFDSHRISDREWGTQGHNFGDGGADPMKVPADGEMDAYAVCDSKSPPIVVKSKTKSVSRFPAVKRADPQGVGTAIAKCPKGSEAVSGGFSSPGNRLQGRAATFPFISKRVGHRKWKVKAINNDFQQRRTLKAFAYCDKREPGLDVQSDKVAVPTGGKRTLDVGCRHGDKPLSGGYSSTLKEAGERAAFAFTSRPISGDRWRVSAFGSGGAAAKADKRAAAEKRGVIVIPSSKLTAYVYCKG
jgi:hypothetical protein